MVARPRLQSGKQRWMRTYSKRDLRDSTRAVQCSPTGTVCEPSTANDSERRPESADRSAEADSGRACKRVLQKSSVPRGPERGSARGLAGSLGQWRPTAPTPGRAKKMDHRRASSHRKVRDRNHALCHPSVQRARHFCRPLPVFSSFLFLSLSSFTPNAAR